MARDRLSNLPENILEKVLAQLSMRDVVRTGVLSTSWRWKYISFPHLMFSDECLSISADSRGHEKLLKIVNHVLLLHRGPVLTFNISSSKLRTCSDINSWILYLSSYPIKEFKLQISKLSFHHVHPCLFSFKNLIHLTLIGCVIVFPAKFHGFSCLTSLFFEKVGLSNATLKFLVSSCPELESLTLIDMEGPSFIEISNPKLKYLKIFGKFIGIFLKDLRLLSNASFHATTLPIPNQPKMASNIILAHLLSIRKLVISGLFLQSLTVGDVATRLSFTYNHLKSITFSLNAKDIKQILIAISLLNSSPNLQELGILCFNRPEYPRVPVMNLQEAEEQLDCTFDKLQTVKMSKVDGIGSELLLIEYILANSPILETVYINSSKNAIDALELSQKLLQFKRASSKVGITYVYHEGSFS